jgi:hypothetical protein
MIETSAGFKIVSWLFHPEEPGYIRKSLEATDANLIRGININNSFGSDLQHPANKILESDLQHPSNMKYLHNIHHLYNTSSHCLYNTSSHCLYNTSSHNGGS